MTTDLPKQPTRNGVCAACGLLVAHHYSARTGRQLDCIEARRRHPRARRVGRSTSPLAAQLQAVLAEARA